MALINLCISNYLYSSLYRQIPLPKSVTGRYTHSLTAVTMSPHCVWLVIVGGFDEYEWKDIGEAMKKPIARYITDTNRLMMIIELGKIINCKEMKIKYIMSLKFIYDIVYSIMCTFLIRHIFSINSVLYTAHTKILLYMYNVYVWTTNINNTCI